MSSHRRRLGLNKRSALAPAKPNNRYERSYPGSLLHLDSKKLRRFCKGKPSAGAGWEYIHICIDAHSRLSYAEILPDERKERVTAFFKSVKAYYESMGIQIEQVMTDYGSGY